MKKMLRIYISSLLIILTGNFLLAQQKPDYNPAEPFSSYSNKMNEYYRLKGRNTPGLNQWKRLEWYQQSRLNPDGTVPDAYRLKQDAIEQVNLYRASFSNSNSSNLFLASWTSLGPNYITSSDNGIGRINRITFHPTNANIFYVTTAGGGLWKTTNGGNSWQSLTDGLPDINTSGVALDYNNTNTLYLLTGDADAYNSGARGCCMFGKASQGVLKSVNGGITWSPTGLNFNEQDGYLGFNIKIHPTNPSILLVSTNAGIYRSDNGANTWALTLNGLIYDIEFKPGNPSIVYASGRDSIYRSQNGGITWAGIYKLPETPSGRCELAVTPNDPEYVYALAGAVYENEYKFRGLFRSINGGNSFSLMANSPNILGRDALGLDVADQSWYDLTIAVDPLDKNHIVTGGIYIFQSFNGGSNFVRMDPSNNYHSDIHDIAFHPLSPSVLLYCGDGGIYRYLYGVNTWNNLNSGLRITQYYRISTAQTNSTQVTGGAQDNGTSMRKTASTSFEEILGADGMDNIISPTNSNYIYASTQFSNIHKSINNGTSFVKIVDEVIDIENNNYLKRWLTPIALDPGNNNILYVGTRPILRVLDVAGNISITPLNGTGWCEHVLKIAPSNGNILFAAESNWYFNQNTIGTKCWRTNDGGSSWIEIYALQNKFMSDIAINPVNPNEIYASFGWYEDGYKVLRSTNGGTNWTNISGSLPNVPVNCIVFQNTTGSPPGAIYIGTDIGVFYRDNNLGDWIPFSNGLPVVEVTDLEIQVSSSMLRAGTYGRGIWETPLFTTSCNASYTFTAGSHAPSTPYFYQASSTISSTAIIAGVGAKVDYRAGNRITLNPGFNVSAGSGAKFNGIIGSCTSGGVPPGKPIESYNGLNGYLIR